MKKFGIRTLSFIFAMLLAGCGLKSEEPQIDSNAPTDNHVEDTEDSINETERTEPTTVNDLSSEQEADEVVEVSEDSVDTQANDLDSEEDDITEEQAQQLAEEEQNEYEKERLQREHQNSFSMMYYLAITAEEIRTSKNNRLILDDIYTSLLNDINPGAIDEITQEHLKNLRDVIKSYITLISKRERLQFIYNQNKAKAIRSAIPNPLTVLSMTNSLDWKKLAMNVVYAAIDSYTSYKNASDSADTEFLMSGWELDDEELATVQRNRDRAFDYMVDMVQEYQLDGLLTLNERAIEKFAEICSIESVPERIKRLTAEEKTYQLLGSYWLELANCYFDIDRYPECLSCVEQYCELSTGIYRQDTQLVQVLPKAIVALQKTCTGDDYISAAEKYADAIIDNSSTEDWSVRYFAAQIYLDLYAKTNYQEYMEKAYQIAYINVTVLLKGQREINETYLRDIVEIKAEEPDYRFLSDKEKKQKEKEYKEEQKKAKEYNNSVKNARKTELLTLYEPLILNCELLFALENEVNISEQDKADIEAILQTSANGTFLIKPINDKYSFSHKDNKYKIELSKDELLIPADLLTAEASITATVTGEGYAKPIEDFVVTKVERKGEAIDSFTVHITSKEMKNYPWSANSKVSIKITYNDTNNETVTFKFYVSEYEKGWFKEKVVFTAE